MNISEEMLGAYLEGNLDSDEMAYVEAELENDPELQELADDVYLYDDAPAVTVEEYGYDYDSIDLPETDDIEVYEAEPIDEFDEEYEFFEINFDDEPIDVAACSCPDPLPDDDTFDFDTPFDFDEIM